MGLNLSNRQIAKELGLNENDVQEMTTQLREGLAAKTPPVVLSGEGEGEGEGEVEIEIEIDEVYVVAGHKGNPAAVEKKAARAAATD
jgi:DNA-binding transcriptional regulator LsrR (DeoR family)